MRIVCRFRYRAHDHFVHVEHEHNHVDIEHDGGHRRGRHGPGDGREPR
jgi:hypothetical protein